MWASFRKLWKNARTHVEKSYIKCQERTGVSTMKTAQGYKKSEIM
ncbi:hypothetical protein BH18THE1_BH18THE1_08290 [soil metagenome]